MRGFYKCIIYKFNLILITLNKQVYIAGNTNFSMCTMHLYKSIIITF